ncbi:MAG: AAA family ATPase, partial [Bacteroidota bacterium]|nr:AAA family ATPase [Bacteroidota bacterium]
YNSREELSLSNPAENKLYRLLLTARYDNESLLADLLNFRVNNSDFIDLNYQSDDPGLSAFVLNTLCKETIAYYTATVSDNNRKSVEFLDSLLQHKQAILQEKTAYLRDYKVRNGILDVNGQASTLIAQIADFETKKQDAEKNISSYRGALKNIDNRFNPNDRKFFESSSAGLNQDILITKNRLTAVNNEYIKSSFDPKYKAKADSLQSLLSYQLNKVNDNYTYNPASSKQELVAQKLNLEVSLELAKNSTSSLGSELNRLNSRLHALVPYQATIKRTQDEIDLATAEYTDLAKKYEQARVDASFSVKLKQVEAAMPGTPKSSKKMLLVILAGIVSFIFCLVVLFIAYFFDNSINDSYELANQTGQPVLGSLNRLTSSKINLNDLWKNANGTSDVQYFKTLLSSLRFELDNNVDNKKIIAITSLQADEGKTFFALNLAYAYTMINKKVLLIDGNFSQPEITEIVKPSVYIEDYLLHERVGVNEFNSGSNLTIIGNKGGDLSLLELTNKQNIASKIDALKNIFDIILIETPALYKMNKAKEWIMFADKVVPVFEASKAIKHGNGIEYLTSLNGKMTGWVLNKAVSSRSVRLTGRKGKTFKA